MAFRAIEELVEGDLFAAVAANYVRAAFFAAAIAVVTILVAVIAIALFFVLFFIVVIIEEDVVIDVHCLVDVVQIVVDGVDRFGVLVNHVRHLADAVDDGAEELFSVAVSSGEVHSVGKAAQIFSFLLIMKLFHL